MRVHGAGPEPGRPPPTAGLYPAPPGIPADIPGLEFAGVVDGVRRRRHRARGRRTAVFGIVGGGAQAEYVARAGRRSARAVPAGLDLVTMGGVPEAFVTAHDALVTRAHVAPGEWVLVHAVGSRRRHRRSAARAARSAHAWSGRHARPTSSNGAGRSASRPRSSPAVDRRRARRRRARVARSSRRPTAASTSARSRRRPVRRGRHRGRRRSRAASCSSARSPGAAPSSTSSRDGQAAQRSSARCCAHANLEEKAAATDAFVARRRAVARRRHDRAGRRRGLAARSGRRGLRAGGVGRDVRQGHPRLPLNVSASGAGQRISTVTVRVDAFPVRRDRVRPLLIEADDPVQDRFEVAGLHDLLHEAGARRA